MLRLYGIPNCDTVKKARKNLESQGADFEFVDFKKVGVDSKNLERWKDFFGDWPVNKRGTTYRKLKSEFEAASEASKKRLICDNPSVISAPSWRKMAGLSASGSMRISIFNRDACGVICRVKCRVICRVICRVKCREDPPVFSHPSRPFSATQTYTGNQRN